VSLQDTVLVPVRGLPVGACGVGDLKVLSARPDDELPNPLDVIQTARGGLWA
jgi:hypothetical protein